MQAGYVVREQAPDISPGRAPAQKIILLVPLERVHQRVLIHHQRIARRGRGPVHVRNAGDHGEHRSRSRDLRYEEIREQQPLLRDRVEIRRCVERVAENPRLECGERLQVDKQQVVMSRGLAGGREIGRTYTWGRWWY